MGFYEYSLNLPVLIVKKTRLGLGINIKEPAGIWLMNSLQRIIFLIMRSFDEYFYELTFPSRRLYSLDHLSLPVASFSSLSLERLGHLEVLVFWKI